MTRNARERMEDADRPLSCRWKIAGVCLFLAAITWLVFGQTLRYGFVNCDDSLYVFENPRVMGGLNLENISWAFTHFDANFYHPLTMISLMLDYQLHGLNAGGYHFTNVLLHTASAIVLFLVLRRMTSLRPANVSGALASAQPPAQPGSAWQAGAVWPSAFVAAVFAIHPLRVESVAWVAERKDVLGAFFFMLALWAYARYARKVVISNQYSVISDQWSVISGSGTAATDHRSLITDHSSPFTSVFYWLCLLFFTLSLLAKPLAVTLPFVLLLLDFWPLGRVPGARDQVPGAGCQMSGADPTLRQSAIGNRQSAIRATLPRLLLEKVPFLLLSAAACVVAVFAQGEAVTTTGNAALSLRFANAAVSYAVYLRQMVWPSGLAMYYPYPGQGIPPGEVVGALVLLAAISFGCLLGWRKRPYLLVGWLWYLGMLVPMIGIVQVGMFARADRFTYLPQIGLYVALVWSGASFLNCSSRRACRAGALRREEEAPNECGENKGASSPRLLRSPTLLGGLGIGIVAALSVVSFIQTSYWREGESLWRRSLACTSDNAVAHNNLGFALSRKGRVDEAVSHLQKALQIKPDYMEACYNLGTALLQNGRADEAIAPFRKALQIKPDDADIHNNLANALSQGGRVDEAMVHYRKALQIQPDSEAAHCNLGNALMQKGDVDEAIAHFQRALQIKPDHVLACKNLGYAFAARGNQREAAAWLQKTLQLQPDHPEVQNNLAWLLATSPEASLRNGARAVALAERANQLTGGETPAVLHTLAAAYAEAGRFSDAVRCVQKAMELVRAAGQPGPAQQLNHDLKLLEAGRPLRQESQQP